MARNSSYNGHDVFNNEDSSIEGRYDGRSEGTSGDNGRQPSSEIYNPFYTGRPHTPANGHKHTPIDRQEIIRRIKSANSRPSSPELRRKNDLDGQDERAASPRLDNASQRPRTPYKVEANDEAGLQIERPRSALHKGDFREKSDVPYDFPRFGHTHEPEAAPSLSTSPVAPWHADFPAAVFRQSRPERHRVPAPPNYSFDSAIRSRAASQTSLASSFVYKPPTSPLVQSSRPDTPEPGVRRRSRSPDKGRRHTFSPPSLQHFHSALEYPASARQNLRPKPGLRFERTFPYQAHQPRRSLHSFSSLPQTPTPGTRRPSFAEASLHHAPMVGSYEESILRGRMSTTPSKPLNFVAQIGVLGKGDCKSNLRCPPHVTVPFPAVFYSYGSNSKATDQPSPYVGLVDLENHLPSAEPSPENRRQKLHRSINEEHSRSSSLVRGEDGSASDAKARRRHRQKQNRRSGSPKAPPGGSYRIPQQGQLQIIIKNPNKTAVKLFLVPYDLSDMEPGQKTFIRQRSYSAGPIIDMPLSSRKNFGTDRPEAALCMSDDPNDRPMLRYLIHLHICCPSKGRYFLYKSMRVVFANRVPDGKEKLRNEIQLPEPRYSTYKAGRDSLAGAGAQPSASADHPRRSDPDVPTTPPPQQQTWQPERRFEAQSLPAMDYGNAYGHPPQSLPFDVHQLSPLQSRPASRQMSDGMDLTSDAQSRSAFPSPISPRQEDVVEPFGGERVFNDSPFVFERDSSREGRVNGRSESLLSRRLRDLAVQHQQQGQGDEGVHEDV